MKLSVTYLYTIFKYGYPPSVDDDFKALADIEAMGFHYLEMEGLGPEHSRQVWERRHDLKRALDDHHIAVHNFCAVDADLVSLESGTRNAAIERFKRTAELGAFLGAQTLHLASYAPPLEYPGGAPYALNAQYQFADTCRVRVPDGFSWPRVWEALLDSCRKTADIARQHGRILLMEPRVGEVICSVDSLLRLIEGVGRDNFKANFDTGHFSAQRENIPLALMKLAGQYANIHVSDNDPRSTDHLPIGKGTIDWEEFFRLLKLQGYDGFLGLTLGQRPSLVEDLRQSARTLQGVAARHGIELEM